jgi:hypothetical protein
VRGPSVFRIVPPTGTLSFAELESQFALRRRIEPADRSEIAECYSALRRQYSEQSRRAQLQFAEPRIKQAGGAALFHLAVESAKASRLVYTALREAEPALWRSADASIVSPEVVERGIDWNRRQLDRLEAQLRLLDHVDGVMLPLRKLFGQLESSRHVSALGWRSIARHLFSQAGRRADATCLPVPGFSLRTYLSLAGHGPCGDAFGRGIETVLALAPVLADRNDDSTQTDLLSLAALCQDCGLLLLGRHGKRGQWRDADNDSDVASHSSIGAGLVAGITELAAELPSLVAEHHRRFIEFGRLPDAATTSQKTGSRLLATTVRFLELVEESPLSPTDGVPQPQAALYPAALRLNHETNRGEWDPKIVSQILSAIGFQLEFEPADVADEELRRDRTANGNRRLDSADQSVPDPNFLFAQEVREGRHVRTTGR